MSSTNITSEVIKEKRTNSLAFSRTSCHTCVSHNLVCDRRRPKCSTCLEKGVQCGGFATPLSWDQSRLWVGQPSQSNPSLNSRGRGRGRRRAASSLRHLAVDKSPSRGFRFVSDHEKRNKRRKIHELPGQDTQDDEPASDLLPPLPDASSTFRSGGDLTAMPGSLNADRDLTEEALVPQPLDTLEGWTLSSDDTTQLVSYAAPPTTANSEDLWNAFTTTFADIFNDMNASNDFNFHIPDWITDPPITRSLSPDGPYEHIPGSLSNQHGRLIEIYDTELSVLPVTGDMALNPFRNREPTTPRSPLLLRAILALCCQHMDHQTGAWSEQAAEYRTEASRLLDSALRPDQISRLGLRLLGPILVMFVLEATRSGSGAWSRHLHRVQRVLETCGGPTALDKYNRPQVGMFLWWDATLALISRRGLIIDRIYLDDLVANQGRDQWTFYELTGCPDDLIIPLVQLSELAEQSEIAATKAWLTFDITPIIQIEATIKLWRSGWFAEPCRPEVDASVEDLTPLDHNEEVSAELQLHNQQDRYHCAEAWRYALLIYIQRIFRWNRAQACPGELKRLARKTLDHVRCCRRTSQTQKQLLLPVFLAGSEVMDEEMCQVVRDYCTWWSERSGYRHFNAAPTILEELWESRRTTPQTWWGSIVDQKTKGEDGEDTQVQFLFG